MPCVGSSLFISFAGSRFPVACLSWSVSIGFPHACLSLQVVTGSDNVPNFSGFIRLILWSWCWRQPALENVNTTSQMTCFRGATVCTKWLQGEVMMNCYSKTTRWEFGHEVKNSEKWNIYERVTKHNANANDNIHACVTLHYTDVNDNINDCVAPHDAYTIDHFHWASCAFSQVVLSCLHPHTHMHFGSSLRLSCHLHVHGHPCVLFTLILPFYFLLYLPPLFLFLNYLKFVVNLHNSRNESMDSTDEFSLSAEYDESLDTMRSNEFSIVQVIVFPFFGHSWSFAVFHLGEYPRFEQNLSSNRTAGVSSSICTVANRSRSWTKTGVYSFICTAPGRGKSLMGFWTFSKYPLCLSLILLCSALCIESLESITNIRSSVSLVPSQENKT